MTESEQPTARILGRYRLRARIGRGRLGDIYEAVDETSLALGAERSVTIQPLDEKFASDPDFVDKLRRGYAALRSGSHPNVVDFLDFGRDGKLRFLMMKFLEGASLRFVLDCVSTLPIDEVIAVVRGLGDALQYLHAKSMFHGRVTPETVFVTDDYEVKLIDLVPALPASPLPGFERPGSGPSNVPDACDDVFGMACLVYELLVGRHPFNSNSPIEARRAGLEPARIGAMPVRQWQALAHGLVLEHEQRTPTIRQFLHELGVRGTERLRPDGEARTESRARPTERPPVRRAPLHEPPSVAHIRMPRQGNVPGKVFAFAVAAGMIVVAFLFRDPLAERVATWTSGSDTMNADRSASGRDLPAETTRSREEASALGLAAADARRQQPVSSGVWPAPPGLDAQTDESPPTGVETAAPAPLAVAAPPVAPVFAVAEPVLSAREDASAVKVELQHEGDTRSTDSVVWWTGDRTALADDDYAAIPEQQERFAPREESRALYVPLIDDSLPEPTESFFVYIGRYGAEDGPLETLAQVKVDIVDDD